MSVWDKNFRYVRAEQQGPDYLRNKFKRIRAEQKEKEAKTQQNVRPLKQAQGNK